MLYLFSLSFKPFLSAVGSEKKCYRIFLFRRRGHKIEFMFLRKARNFKSLGKCKIIHNKHLFYLFFLYFYQKSISFSQFRKINYIIRKGKIIFRSGTGGGMIFQKYIHRPCITLQVISIYIKYCLFLNSPEELFRKKFKIPNAIKQDNNGISHASNFALNELIFLDLI